LKISSKKKKIQRTIREELNSAIVITIAHRLKTVMDYDRILVLDEGRIVEFDAPWVLLQTPNSAFREMCRKSADWLLFLQMSKDRSESPK
jgi:ABC-type multidrug transport system fused ATPase/permease subunit